MSRNRSIDPFGFCFTNVHKSQGSNMYGTVLEEYFYWDWLPCEEGIFESSQHVQVISLWQSMIISLHAPPVLLDQKESCYRLSSSYFFLFFWGYSYFSYFWRNIPIFSYFFRLSCFLLYNITSLSTILIKNFFLPRFARHNYHSSILPLSFFNYLLVRITLL